MTQIPNRRARNAMIAGTVGEAVAAEFAVIADDIAASVHIEDMLAADRKARADLYPDTLHGLNAVVFGLVGAADAGTMPAVIDAMEQIRTLAHQRSEPTFTSLPLAELCAFGFEMLLAKALDQGLTDAFAGSAAYQRYAADRRDAGLD
jgi:hypothetical protein